MDELRELTGRCRKLNGISAERGRAIMRVLFLLHYRFPLPESELVDDILLELGRKRPIARRKRNKAAEIRRKQRRRMVERGLLNETTRSDDAPEVDFSAWEEFYTTGELPERVPDDD